MKYVGPKASSEKYFSQWLVLSALWGPSMRGSDGLDLTWYTDNGQLYGDPRHFGEFVIRQIILETYNFSKSLYCIQLSQSKCVIRECKMDVLSVKSG